MSDHQPPSLTTEQVALIRPAAERSCREFGARSPSTRSSRERYENWDRPDSSGQPIEVVGEIRDQIRTRAEAFIATLRLDRPTSGAAR